MGHCNHTQLLTAKGNFSMFVHVRVYHMSSKQYFSMFVHVQGILQVKSRTGPFAMPAHVLGIWKVK